MMSVFCHCFKVRLKLNLHKFMWFQRPTKITCLCVYRCRTSVSTTKKCWSLGRKCPSCSSCRLQMKCAQLLVRITHTPPALASSPCPCRSLNWVSISNFRQKRVHNHTRSTLYKTNIWHQLLFPNPYFSVFTGTAFYMSFFFFPQSTLMPIAPVSLASTAEYRLC